MAVGFCRIPLQPVSDFNEFRTEPTVEEVLVVILQGLVEFFLEFLIYVGLDFAAMSDERGCSKGCTVIGLMALAGVGLGALVNVIHPRPVLPLPWLRITNLIAGPIFAGALSAVIARRRQRDASTHFWMAFAFILAYNAVRFAYAKV
jgi:hypothetical protein